MRVVNSLYQSITQSAHTTHLKKLYIVIYIFFENVIKYINITFIWSGYIYILVGYRIPETIYRFIKCHSSSMYLL